jgi:hypothetical protein
MTMRTHLLRKNSSKRTRGFSYTVCLSVSYERCTANSAGLALWIPQAENVETVLLPRGDTIIIPPGAVHKFVNVTDIFCPSGLFMERETLYIHIGLAREQKLYHYPKLLIYQNELLLPGKVAE